MINLFRKKHKRSEWFEGLQAGEGIMKTHGEDDCYVTYYNEVCRDQEDYDEFAKGYFDYMCHYRNNLK